MIVLYRKISIITNSIQNFSTNIIFSTKKTRNIAINHIPRNLNNLIRLHNCYYINKQAPYSLRAPYQNV